MKFEIIDTGSPESCFPLTSTRRILDIPVGGATLLALLADRLHQLLDSVQSDDVLKIMGDFWVSKAIVSQIIQHGAGASVADSSGVRLAWIPGGTQCLPLQLDSASKHVRHPWDVLTINEEIVGALNQDDIRGKVRERVTIDGHIRLGEGSVILPGVYIEGNVVIGKDCRIGPNCFIRGSTHIGDGCHVGQAVEIKNSILMDKVAAGHLSYVGDSIVGFKSNLGAGTITSNFRHDGKSQTSVAMGRKIDTGRRKLGAFLGDGVHTGVHTSIYPGRKIWPDLSTRPGEVVDKDKTN